MVHIDGMNVSLHVQLYFVPSSLGALKRDDSRGWKNNQTVGVNCFIAVDLFLHPGEGT